MTTTSMLKLLSWNCHQLPPLRKLSLLHSLETLKIDVLCLQESNGGVLKHPDYTNIQFHKDLLVLIKRDIRFTIHYSSSDNDCLIITLQLHDIFLIFSYIRDGKTASGISKLLDHLSSYDATSNPKICLLGDLNTHRNTASRRLDAFLESNDLYDTINDNTPTFRHSNSVLDRCLLSFPAFQIYHSFQVVMDSAFDSDHFPILLTLNTTNNSRHFEDRMLADKLYPIRRHAIHHKKIPQEFADTLDGLSLNQEAYTWDDLKLHIVKSLKLSHVIQHCFKRHVRLTLPRQLLDSLKAAHASGNVQDLRSIRNEITNFRREQWCEFIESIDFEVSPKLVWIKFNNSRGRPIIPVRVGDGFAEVNSLKEQLSSFFRIEIGHPIPQPDLSTEVRELFIKFTLDELTLVLQQLNSSSAPGPDGLPYNIFQCMGPLAKSKLLEIYNQCLRSGTLPSSFKYAVQNAIPKSDGGVRGITLMNAAVKILERLIYNRIKNPILDTIPDYQYGFRQGLSAIDQAARLIVAIQQAKLDKQNVGILFLDIKKAFDRVDHHLLILDLVSIGIPLYLIRLIFCLIANNKVTVLLNGFASDEYSPGDGLPQGGIISPLLFIFYMRNLPAVRTVPFALADDVALVSFSPSGVNPALALSSDYARVRNHFQDRRIQLSDTKIRSMFIMHNRKRFHHLWVHAHGHRVTECSSYKYLGIWIDNNLNFQRFTDHVVAELKARINVIRRIAACVRLSRTLIEKFYSAYARGYLNYVSPLFPTLADHLVNRIERADRHGLRLCIGALPGTRITAINKETTLLTFPVYTKKCVLNYGARVIHNPELAALRDFFFYRENSELVRSWHELWEYYAVPAAPNINDARTSIRRQMRRAKDKWKYHRHWPWKERTLSRLRMACLPTRVWAFKLHYTNSNLCRHCHNAVEDWAHLFTSCSALDLSLRLYWDLNFDVAFNEESFIKALHNRTDRIRRPLEDATIRFIESNDLFKRS
jgi:endonuclease/exonuclease/phosphatase family metal-dependent hydrolase